MIDQRPKWWESQSFGNNRLSGSSGHHGIDDLVGQAHRVSETVHLRWRRSGGFARDPGRQSSQRIFRTSRCLSPTSVSRATLTATPP